MFYPLHWFLSLLASALRLGAGGGPRSAHPSGPVLPILYEFEACPHCRITREAISASGMRVHIKPCPKNGERFRPDVSTKGDKAQFPFLVDPHSGEGAYESRQLARQIEAQAGLSRPLVHWLGPINTVLSQYAVLFRLMKGRWAQPSKPAAIPFEYLSTERHPGGRLVKERLCALELEYVWIPISGASPRLKDPNTDADITGSAKILEHLKRHYAA